MFGLFLVFTSLIAGGCAPKGEPGIAGNEEADAVAADAALVASFDQAAAQAVDTPAMESTLHEKSQSWMRKFLMRQKEATPEQLVSARQYFKNRVREARMGPDWPEPPTISVPHASGAINIDGRLTESSWREAATFSGVYRFNDSSNQAAPKTIWKITWDKNNLYFAFVCEDRDIRAEPRQRDDAVFSDDCVEMFILPSMRSAVYWELVISPAEGIYDGLHAKKLQQWGAELRPQRNIEGLRVGYDIRGSINDGQDQDQGYTVEVAVPFSQLPEYERCQPSENDTIHLMLVRLDRTGEKLVPYAFIPLMSWGHNIWNHATIQLQGRQ